MSAPGPKTVAFVSAVYPYPADNGKKVVIAGFLRFLHEAVGAENITYVGLGTFDQSVRVPFRTVIIPLGGATRRLSSVALHALMLRRKSLQEALLYSPRAQRRLRRTIEALDPDIVIMDTIRIAQFFEKEIARTPKRRWILYMEDLFSERYRSLLADLGRDRPDADPLGAFAYAVPAPLRPLARPRSMRAAFYSLEQRLVARREQRLARTVDRVCLVNPVEASNLAAEVAEAEVWETPPCIATPPARRRAETAAHGPFVILGALHYPPNIIAVQDFLAEAMPRIAREMPSARVVIVGKGASDSLRSLAARWKPHIELVGFVPKLDTLFEKAAAMIVPIRIGSGFKLKVLEALAHGLPLITTGKGIESIPIEPGVHGLVSDDIAEFPEFMRTLRDPETNAQVSAHCRELFEQHYAQEAAYPRYAAAFLDQ
ncbi:MAG: glycosyltransferase [Reyranella sp.]|uniref:glycosyltransferase n=1 Tax=Reyranella sp. TaxID=1929291 RepID=UPI001AC49EA9|nr:glycosyltransferase [Reyranella sp.]MBN9086978.1 glycosyltransferase [Reyranella sp.]